MLSSRALRDTITVYIVTHPGGSGSGEGGTDRYGDPIESVAQGVNLPAYVEPVREDEDLKDQDRRVSHVRVLLAPDAPIDGVSRFTWQSSSYEVMGEAKAFRNRNGDHHQELIGRRVLGG